MSSWVLITGCVAAAASALLPLRRALFAAAALLMALGLIDRSVVGGGATGALNPLSAACAFLVVLVIRHLAEQRRRAQHLLAVERAAVQAQAEAAADLERSRIARDLHDGLAHHLSGLLLQVQAAQALLEDDDQAGASMRMQSSADLARQCLLEARDVVGVLRAGSIDLETMSAIASDWATAAGRRIDMRLPDHPIALDGSRWGAVLAVLRESLTNVGRHSCSQQVILEISASGAGLRLTVADSHPDPSAARSPAAGGGYGLAGLSERAALLGGTLRAGPQGQGWQVELLLPPVEQIPPAQDNSQPVAKAHP